MSTKIAISQFKSHCLEIIEKLQVNGQSVIITKREKAIAKVLPIDTKKVSLFGMLKNKAEIKADILEPIDEKWNVEHE
ncbi:MULTISPECIES: type II toxin-antitoxin system Phd/YefM family antitoxin [unclassified Candidatus Tisiphia]|jgi:antitoxin (DNA-binding transcriptional repressor) of toxin-antitoxin stability system|uniref:Antitoxin n=1 Tax=Candidatus Tisiphia endosymbiont of Sergentomyia squamirostris TaxID=3113639 RepID=A0AAT9GA50_9RICK|nr:MAG: type II toxin-antitoxin system Phd/YefM family antitoxin [Rickettsia endosymbiont of Cimex lectularius]